MLVHIMGVNLFPQNIVWIVPSTPNLNYVGIFELNASGVSAKSSADLNNTLMLPFGVYVW